MSGDWITGLVGLIVGVTIAGGLQQLRVSNAQTALAKAQAAYSDRIAEAASATTLALNEARMAKSRLDDIQQTLHKTIATNSEEAVKQNEKYQALVAAGAAQSHSLREQLATLTARAARDRAKAGDAAALAADLDRANATVRVLADVHGRLVQRDREVSEFADRSHAAALSCARDYNQVKDTLDGLQAAK